MFLFQLQRNDFTGLFSVSFIFRSLYAAPILQTVVKYKEGFLNIRVLTKKMQRTWKTTTYS